MGADLGPYSGVCATQMFDPYGCRVTAVGITPSPLAAAERSNLRPVNADLQHLPFHTRSDQVRAQAVRKRRCLGLVI
jgi:hypothetical protein